MREAVRGGNAVFCFLILCASRSQWATGESIPRLTGEEEWDLGALLPRLYSYLPEIYASVMDLSSLGEVGQTAVTRLAEEYTMFDNHTGPSDKCVECRALVGVLQTAAENGDYFELEEAVLDLCYAIVNDSDDLGIPEYICPGIIDNYVSHALVILNSTTLNQIDICLLWNECLYFDFDPPLSDDSLVCVPAPLPPAVRAKPKLGKPRDLEGAIKVVHMTDIHVDLEYDIGSPTMCGMPTCCRELWPGTGFAGYWGDYQCNQPTPITDVMLQFLATQNISYFMYTGDNPPHTVWLDTYDSQMNASRALIRSFQNNLPGVPVFYTLGNHDIHPTNLYYYNRTDVQAGNADLADLWGSLAGFGPDQVQTFQDGAYFSMLLRPGLRVLSYNSNHAWLENFYGILDQNPPDYQLMKEFMESTLEAARQAGEKVILLGHHPTGQSAARNEYSCYVTDLHARYGDVIILHLSGHKHGDLYRLVRDIDTGETRGVQMSSPAGGSRTDRNPSLRVLHLDPVTYDVLEADTYRVNMSLLEGDPDGSLTPVVELGYRFTEEYGMADLSPASFEDFILRMETDEELFSKYLLNEATGNPARVDDCDADCQTKEICQMLNTAYPGYLVCTGQI